MKKIVYLALFWVSVGFVSAQTEKPIHEIHAAMIYNFLKYIQWPDDGGTDFVVGVLGEDNVFNTLKSYYDGKPKGSKKYAIKKLSDPSEAASCSVVYIGKNKSKDFDNVRNAITGKSILTITDSFNLGKKGSCINFKVIDEKLKFEINQASMGGANLKVASQLSSMAILI
ncbi:MAG: YfiR family protein [Bacteroidetes bacterium]|nr:YfiR family protein [Bacteroidota bacterium]